MYATDVELAAFSYLAPNDKEKRKRQSKVSSKSVSNFCNGTGISFPL